MAKCPGHVTSVVTRITATIAAQEQHHAQWSYEQEFLTLLRNFKIEFDPATSLADLSCPRHSDLIFHTPP
jgi:hypothetical protein